MFMHLNRYKHRRFLVKTEMRPSSGSTNRKSSFQKISILIGRSFTLPPKSAKGSRRHRIRTRKLLKFAVADGCVLTGLRNDVNQTETDALPISRDQASRRIYRQDSSLKLLLLRIPCVPPNRPRPRLRDLSFFFFREYENRECKNIR